MKTKTTKFKFSYKKRSAEATHKRATQKGGMYENPWTDTYPQFIPGSGDNTIRILPPTWKDPQHYGLDIFCHNRIGAEGGTYTCPAKNKGEKCPVCDEIERMKKDGEDKEALTPLYAKKRVLMLVIDRDKEKEGPKLWVCPWTVDREIALQSEDKRNKRVLAIDDPEEGYDVMFRKEGKGLNTEYVGVQVERSSSALSEDPERIEKWLRRISKTTVEDCIIWTEKAKLEKAIAGLSVKKEPDRERRRGKKESKRVTLDDDDMDELDDDEIPEEFR